MSRVAVGLVMLLALAFGGLAPVAAQDATPAADGASAFADLGLPEVRVTVTDEAFTVDTPEVAAGLVLLTGVNESSTEQTVALFRLPEGMSLEDTAPPPSTPGAAATPGAEEGGEFPEFLYEATISGGPFVAPGESVSVVVELSAGQWYAAGEGDQAPGMLTVTGEAATPDAAMEPPADLEFTAQEFAFVGLPEQLPAGPQVWKVENTGDQPHHVVVFGVPPGTTIEEIFASFEEGPPGTPAAGEATPTASGAEEEEAPGGGVEIFSAGQTVWFEIDLPPGTYLVVCFIPDRETGMPHALMGMAQLVTVGEDGAADATPETSGGTDTGGAASGEAAVEIADFSFTTDPVRVTAGGTVTWTNQDSVPHTATADDGSFTTEILNNGDSESVTFDTAGTFTYFCQIHPDMKGTVEVS